MRGTFGFFLSGMQGFFSFSLFCWTFEFFLLLVRGAQGFWAMGLALDFSFFLFLFYFLFFVDIGTFSEH